VIWLVYFGFVWKAPPQAAPAFPSLLPGKDKVYYSKHADRHI